VAIGVILADGIGKELHDVVSESGLAFADEYGGRGVLRIDTDNAVLNPCRIYFLLNTACKVE
jgi:hypothetical protein